MDYLDMHKAWRGARQPDSSRSVLPFVTVDLEALRADPVARTLLGLCNLPEARR